MFEKEFYWEGMVEVSVKAYLILRDNYQLIIDFARLVFSHSQLKLNPEKFLMKRLYVEKSTDYAAEKIRKKFKDAPRAFATLLKNTVHDIATKM